MPHDEAEGGKPSTSAAWRTWLPIGATGFGGPAGQIAILHREAVERKRWLGEDEFLAALRLCMLLPGPEAQQLATYAGWRIGGVMGGIVAGSLFILPGAVLVTSLAWLHAAGRDLPLVAAAFAGVRPAVVALVALAAWRIGRKALRTTAAAVLAVAAAAALAWGAPFPAVVAAAALLGLCLPAPAGHDKESHAAMPAATGPRRGWLAHAALVTGVAAAAWAACYALVAATAAAGGRAAAIARLFTETTLLSFGGAYAVVPWALDESVARGWLEPGERFAALAMGEATPGPLILVVTFIGFLAGWKADPAAAAVNGLAGAGTATLFAFLPSFALVLALAPAVRSIRAGSGLGRALHGVGAAVVAAIVTLAVTLARGAFLDGGRVDPLAVAVAAAAAVALGWAKVPTPLVVLAAAAAGMVRAVA